MDRFHRALVRDPYYKAVARHFGLSHLASAGFIDNHPDGPFPDEDSVRWPSYPLDVIRVGLGKQVLGKTPVVLVNTGSYAPLHEGHIAMMNAARVALEAQGEWVVGGIFSPSHDAYVGYKGDGQEHYPIGVRLSMMSRVLHDNPLASWIGVDSWEAQGVSVAVNFTDVLARLEVGLARHFGRPIDIVYVFGSDNQAFMRTFVERGRAVCVERPGYPYTSLWNEDWIDLDRHKRAPSLLSVNVSSSMKRREQQVSRVLSEEGVYVVRDDWPMVAAHWGVSKDHLDPANTVVSCLREGLDQPTRMFVVADVVRQQTWADGLVAQASFPVVSLDVWLRTQHCLDVSRVFCVAQDQSRALALIARPESIVSLERQVDAVPLGPVVVLDDDTASGQTLGFVQELLGSNRPIVSGIYLADCDRPARLFDVVDVRDFLLGAPYGGLVVRDAQGVPIRVPYMAPYVNLGTRARLDWDRCLSVSLQLWRWNAHVMQQMHDAGAVLSYAETLDRFAALSGHSIDWSRPFESLSALAHWHACLLVDALLSGDDDDGF